MVACTTRCVILDEFTRRMCRHLERHVALGERGRVAAVDKQKPDRLARRTVNSYAQAVGKQRGVEFRKRAVRGRGIVERFCIESVAFVQLFEHAILEDEPRGVDALRNGGDLGVERRGGPGCARVEPARRNVSRSSKVGVFPVLVTRRGQSPDDVANPVCGGVAHAFAASRTQS